jgi:hypothetical protein
MFETTFVVDWALTSGPEDVADGRPEVSQPSLPSRVVHCRKPALIDLEHQHELLERVALSE